jgi:opacity protein-like surface antigen
MRTFLAALFLVIGAGAATAQVGWYARGFGGVTFPRSDSTGVEGLVWAFERDPVPPAARIIWPAPRITDLDYDAGYTLGAAAGYAIRPDVAVELELAYRAADLKGGFYDNATSTSAMVNALYRFQPMGPDAAWRPYVGGGIGWASLDVSTEWMGSFERDDALAYQLIAGAAYRLTPAWSLTGEVRWFATDGGTLENGRWLSIDSRFQTVDVLLGAAYRF